MWLFPVGLGLSLAGWALYATWFGFKRGHVVAVHSTILEADRPNQPILFWFITTMNVVTGIVGLWLAAYYSGLQSIYTPFPWR